MTGAITVTTIENLEIHLGEQNDTFYLRGAPAGVNPLKTNGGFDKVYIGSAANTLDDILGTLVVEGDLPFSQIRSSSMTAEIQLLAPTRLPTTRTRSR